MFDQFIASGERKWLRMSGLVCLLPHGYEGQGPEHSSARLERFLQLSAEDNLQVCVPTTPANYFHVLRRQLKRDFRKPLILMTPKSLLRHKRCTSTLDELAEGSSFHRVLHDDAHRRPEDGVRLVPDDKMRRVVVCTGKVYYDLAEEREKRGLNDVTILRVEQLYPFPRKALTAELARFPQAEVVWCQEEPRNQGAWTFVGTGAGVVPDPGRRRDPPRPLHGPPALRLHRGRADVEAPRPAQGLHGRRAGGVTGAPGTPGPSLGSAGPRRRVPRARERP